MSAPPALLVSLESLRAAKRPAYGYSIIGDALADTRNNAVAQACATHAQKSNLRMLEYFLKKEAPEGGA